MNIAQEPVFLYLSQYAYEPTMVYVVFTGMMLISAIGFPLPEEVTLISLGLLAFIGNNPDLFPPPVPGAASVDIHSAAVFAFVVVVLSDFLIYCLGRFGGRKLLKWKIFQRIFANGRWEKIERWTHKYGVYACGVFRFTPGIRFPGHLATGMMRFPVWKFLLVDALAAGVSVPTQILLIGHYGEPILEKLREFKFILLGVLVAVFVGLVFQKILSRKLVRVKRVQ